MTTLTPTDVVARAASVIAVPKAAAANSFVLHAPLELAARVGLLPYLPAGGRADALAMIDWLREQYLAAGDPVEPPAPVPATTDDEAARRLVAAVTEGDLDQVDAWAAAWLPRVSIHTVIGEVGEALAPSLAAAGHAPIGLALLRRVAPHLSPELLRGALRSIAMRPEWQVRWQHDVLGEGDALGLYAAVRSTPALGRPGSDFIHPLMSQVQDSGLCRRQLGPVLADRYDLRAAARTLARVATWSMVHDDPSQAPYGWSHALTMPQAVMALAGAGVRPRTALAVAATFTLGFRAAHGTMPLPERIEPGEPPSASVGKLALAASGHEDAHLVKFTLACLHAAADDPGHAALHLRAAQTLVEWWQTR